ncbi:EamA family transporter, partial [Xanthovirga aplysinae]|uniref:EamA family transporter n=1 Tax=Xanthovirga aplysinae TaxID=2529853 RepID=UPI0012BC4067
MMQGRAMLIVFLGACSYGILSTIVKLSYKVGFTVQEVTGIQLLLGAITFWLINGVQHLLMRKEGSRMAHQNKLTLKEKGKLLLMGMPIGLTSITYYICVRYVPASLAILFLFQFTWIGMLLESIISGRRPSRLQLVSLFFLLFGTFLATGITSVGWENFNVPGVFFGLLAALSYALFIFFNSRANSNVPTITRNQWMLTGAVLISLPIFPPEFIFNGALGKGLIAYGIPLALFGAIIPPFFYAIGVPKTGVNMASVLSAAELPVAVFVSSMVLKETVSFSQWMGVIIILAGII